MPLLHRHLRASTRPFGVARRIDRLLLNIFQGLRSFLCLGLKEKGNIRGGNVVREPFYWGCELSHLREDMHKAKIGIVITVLLCGRFVRVPMCKMCWYFARLKGGLRVHMHKTKIVKY